MKVFSPPNDSCKGFTRGPNKLSDLTPAASYAARALAIVSASLLICASAGLGAFYAAGQGAGHGFVFSGLLVVMALGLELAKPFSIAAALQALRKWRVVQGTLLALLGIVAIAYSLSAELSLMATARGDKVAERAATSDIAIKARNRYQRAELELDRLAVARPSAELQSLVDGVLSDPRAGGCHVIDGPFTRDQCPKVVEWKSEQGRAERRAELEKTMRDAERDMSRGPATRVADPGATALAAYLAIFGIKSEPGLLSELLILVGVVALEMGSALSLVLVQAVSPNAVVHGKIRRADIVTEPVVQVVHPSKSEPADDPAHVREKVKSAILDQLKERGGEVGGSERGLAALIGASRPTVRRAINGLMVAGIIAAEANRNGTVLRLIA